MSEKYTVMSIRMPEALRDRIYEDSAKDLRSFSAQVLKILTDHYKEKKNG